MAALPQHTPKNAGQSERRLLPWSVMLDHVHARSERIAWWVAGIAVSIAVTAVMGVIALATQPRYIPYLLAVDRAHGDVLAVGAVDNRTVKGYQELLDKYWVERYVVAREAYTYRLLQEDYDTVMEMSEDPAAQEFAHDYDGPNARDKRYGSKVEIIPRISSVQLSANGVGLQATVHYSTSMHHLDTNQVDPAQYFIVTLGYRYDPHMFGKELDLIRNPLGFKVAAYRPVSELPPASMAGDQSSTAVPGG